MRGPYKHTTEEEKFAARRNQRRTYRKKKWNSNICDIEIDIGSKCGHLRINAHRDYEGLISGVKKVLCI